MYLIEGTPNGKRDLATCGGFCCRAVLAKRVARSARNRVERINVYPLYELAQSLQSIRKCNGTMKLSDLYEDICDSSDGLTRLLDGVPLRIVVSKAAANELLNY